MNLDFTETVFMLMFAHFLADYPLQGNFLATAKNHTKPIDGIPWYQALLAHSFIHAGFVFLITNSIGLAFIQLINHAAIDYVKCEKKISYNVDQLLHFITAVCLAFLYIW